MGRVVDPSAPVANGLNDSAAMSTIATQLIAPTNRSGTLTRTAGILTWKILRTARGIKTEYEIATTK
jgi:hypothetical protein